MTGKEFIERNKNYYFELDDDAQELKLICRLNDDSNVIVRTFTLDNYIYRDCSPDNLINGLIWDLKNAESVEAMHNITNTIAQIKQDAKLTEA